MLNGLSVSDKIELIKSGAIFCNPLDKDDKALFYKGYSFSIETNKDEGEEFIPIIWGSGFHEILDFVLNKGYTLFNQGYAWTRDSGEFYASLDSYLDGHHYSADIEFAAKSYCLTVTLPSGRVIDVSAIISHCNTKKDEEISKLEEQIHKIKESNGEAYRSGYEASQKSFENVREKLEREFFRKGWDRAQNFHQENQGWTKKEKKKENRNYSGMSNREKLGAILEVNPSEKELSVWKKARRRYLLDNHSDRNPSSDGQEIAEMNSLWDKVFG